MSNPSPQSTRTIVLAAFGEAFLRSHAMPAARAAREAGCAAVIVATRPDAREAVEAAGARFVLLDTEPSGLNPLKAGYTAGTLSGVLRTLEPALVHGVGANGIMIGATAATMAGIAKRVFTVTGLGALRERRDAVGTLSRAGLKAALRAVPGKAQSRFLVETAEDAAVLGLDPLDTAVRILRPDDIGGLAGVYAELMAT